MKSSKRAATRSGILTVGSMAFDSVQTPAGKAESVLGGSANYFSVAASFFSPIRIVAVVGEDFPKDHLKWLETKGIDTSGVKIAPGKTFHWVGQYDQNLNEAKTLSTFLNVFEHFDPTLSDPLKNSDTVFLGNIDPTLQLHVLDQVRKPRLVACDSMNFWITGKPDALKETLKRVDLLSINEGEAYLLSGHRNLAKAAEKILSMGPVAVAIKRGEYGAALFTRTQTFLAPAYIVDNVVDPTGAGDSFAGAMVGFLHAQKFDRKWFKKDRKKFDRLLRRAMLYGCVMASFTVEDFSLQRLKRLKAKEFDSRLKRMQAMIAL